jgi:hypothetical protein
MSENHPSFSAAIVRRRFIDQASKTAIFLVLAGLGWWGHHAGWSLGGRANSVSECTACHGGTPWVVEEAEPIPGSGWCEVHGVHACPTCRPALAQVEPPPTIDAAESHCMPET